MTSLGIYSFEGSVRDRLQLEQIYGTRAPQTPDDCPVKAIVYVGTAGWAIPRVQASRFPREGAGLQRYSARLNAVEINSSFYRAHQPETWMRWAASVPPQFRLAVKMPKSISHERQWRGVSKLLQAFLNESAILGEKRGPTLL